MIASLPMLAWPSHKQILTILMYHRVLPAPDPIRPDEVVAGTFDSQMQFLARHFVVLPLLEAAQRLSEGALPRRACCITFDDGYADNLAVALPILEKYHLPATIFVATGYLDGGRMFNDAVIDAVAGAKAHQLDLREFGQPLLPLTTLADRQVAVAVILKWLRYQRPKAREVGLAKVIELTGCGSLARNIMLTAVQVGELSRRGVEIGGHTVAHTILTTLDDEGSRQEMTTGKKQLETMIGKSVKAFAYPNGQPGRDYAARHAAMAREVGFELAVTTARGVGNSASDLYQLPRLAPWGKSLTMFGARMVRNAWTGKAVAIC